MASIERRDPALSPTNADSLTWRVTFSEDVANVNAADFSIGGTTAMLAVSEVTVSSVYDVIASGVDLESLNATVTLSFASAQDIADTAGNALANTAPTGTNENTYDVDNTAPTVTITDVPDPSSAPFTATFTFSDAVTGFALGDIVVGNGAASEFTTSSASVYTALITPVADGRVTVGVEADVATDLAGNGNTAATQATSTYDATAPRVASIERRDPALSPTNADSLTWRVTFSKDVANVNAADFSIGGTTAMLAVSEVTVSSVYDVIASGVDLESLNATVTLSFASAQDIADTAGNALANTAPTGTNENTYDVDNTAPTVTITDVPDPSSAPFTATFTFSDAVTGFALGDIVVGNGAASEFTTSSASVYTALITPVADGRVTVDVEADVATDLAGNGNTAATQATSTYTAPVTNTAPMASDWSVTTEEDTAYTFAAADFNFFDPDPGAALAGLTVEMLPEAGGLAVDGTAVIEGQVVVAADIGKLVFTPAADANGSGYASFTFRVSDGTDVSVSAYTMTVNVTAVNDPAEGAPTISGTARVDLILTAERGNIADTDGLPATFPDDYTFQWVLVDGSTETDIAGETQSTYVPTSSDVGKSIKVKVGFTDGAGNEEDPLISEAVGPVAAEPGVTVSETALTVAEEDAAGGSYTVVLTSQPTADVTVTVSGAGGHGRDGDAGEPGVHDVELGHGADGDGEGGRRCGHGERPGRADPRRGERRRGLPGDRDRRREGDGDRQRYRAGDGGVGGAR